MEIKLIASTGRAKGQAVEIRASKFFIGQHDHCQLRPDLPDLAGIHALIEFRDNGYHLRDFGGEGGTGINDRVIFRREIEVFDGDLIQIGPMVLTLSIKPKGDDRHTTYREVPEGWPFLEGTDNPQAMPQVEAAPNIELAAPSHREPVPLLTPIARELPARLSDFLESQPTDRAVVAASAVIEAPVVHQNEPSVTARPPSRPIVTRSKPLRAITCHQVDNVTVVTLLSSDLNEEETVSPVRYELRTLLEQEELPERTVIDLGNTKFLSSRAVGVLLAHYQALDRQGCSMRVCNVSKAIQPVLDQMRLSRLVDIYPTLEEAIDDPWE